MNLMTALHIFTYGGLSMFGGLVLGYLIAAWKNLDASRWGFIGFICPPAVLWLLVRPRGTGKSERLSWDAQDARDHAHHNPPN